MRQWPVAALLCLIAACGGGGDSGGGSSSGSGSSGEGSGNTVTYRVGGAVTGLNTNGLVLQNNNTVDLNVVANGAFQFNSRYVAGSAYRVSVKKQPENQHCEVTSEAGVVGTQDIDTVQVSCADDLSPGGGGDAKYALSGTIENLNGQGLQLWDGVQILELGAGMPGFTFSTRLPIGYKYVVEIRQQPTGQLCQLINGVGVIRSSDVSDISVICSNVSSGIDGIWVAEQDITLEVERGETFYNYAVTAALTGAMPGRIDFDFTKNGLAQVGASSLSSKPFEINLYLTHSAYLQPGTYKDSISVKVCYDWACTREMPNSPKIINVNYVVKPNKPKASLIIPYRGIAFSSTPSGEFLTRRMQISDSSGVVSTWSAVSNAPWLTASASGKSGDALEMRADRTGLAEGFHEAEVVVSSSNPSIEGTQSIKVGFYISRQPSATAFITKPSVPSERYDAVRWVVDPVRPLSYSSNGSIITAHHSYTGRNEFVYDFAPAQLGGVAISDDGAKLYIEDLTNTKLKVFDLRRRTELASLDMVQLKFRNDNSFSRTIFKFARLHSQPLLVAANGSLNGFDDYTLIFNADTGRFVGRISSWTSWMGMLEVSKGSPTLFLSDRGKSGPLKVTRFNLQTNSLENVFSVGVESPSLGAPRVDSLIDLAINDDGTAAFSRHGSESFVRTWQWSTGDLSNTPLPNSSFNSPVDWLAPANVEAGPDGILVIGDGYRGVRVFDGNNQLLAEWLDLGINSVGSAARDGMRITSDGRRVLGGGYMLDLFPKN